MDVVLSLLLCITLLSLGALWASSACIEVVEFKIRPCAALAEAGVVLPGTEAACTLLAPSGASCIGQRQGLKGVLVPLCFGCPKVFYFLFIFLPQRLVCCVYGVSVGEIWEK